MEITNHVSTIERRISNIPQRRRCIARISVVVDTLFQTYNRLLMVKKHYYVDPAPVQNVLYAVVSRSFGSYHSSI